MSGRHFKRSTAFPSPICLPANITSSSARWNRNCNIDPKPARLEFSVVLPWYRETRLLLISFAGLGCALFFAGLSYNRHRRLLRSYTEVEQKVAQRTRELEIANRELLHSQKMNALGTLAAGIAHDFNNILSIIKGSAQIIEDNVENPQKVRTRVDRIKTVVEQGAGIVKAMLGFSRDSADQLTACDLNEAMKDTIKLLGDRFLREVQVTFEPATDVPDVMCSKDFIQQILLNFIFKRGRVYGQRKQVILSTRTLETLPPGMILAPAKTPVYAAISVKDFGSGIPPEICPGFLSRFSPPKQCPRAAALASAFRWFMNWPKNSKPASPSNPSSITAACLLLSCPFRKPRMPRREPRLKWKRCHEIRNSKFEFERIPGAGYGNDICCFEISRWPRRIFPLQRFSTLINTPLQRGGGCDYALDKPFQRFSRRFLRPETSGMVARLSSNFEFRICFEFRVSSFGFLTLEPCP